MKTINREIIKKWTGSVYYHHDKCIHLHYFILCKEGASFKVYEKDAEGFVNLIDTFDSLIKAEDYIEGLRMECGS